LDTFHKQDRRVIEGFLAGRKEDYQTVTRWISSVVKLSTWGLEGYSDDIVQDVLLKLYDNLKEEKFKFHSSLKTYIYKIAKFTCIDYIRKYSSAHQGEVELTEIQSNVNSGEKTREEEEKTLWRIYRLMPEECRELWDMIFFEKLSYLEIAQKLDIKEGTVKSRFFRCKQKAIELKNKLQKTKNFFDSDTTI